MSLYVVLDIASSEKYINPDDLTINLRYATTYLSEAKEVEAAWRAKGHIVETHEMPELGVEQDEY